MKKLPTIIFFLFLANVFIWGEVLSFKNELEVVFLDIGQGDSTFIETPEGHQIIVDGGPNGDLLLEKLEKYIPFWDRSIDLIILTHPDYDHLRGLNDVLDRYDVENIIWNGVRKDSKTFEKWFENIYTEDANIYIGKKGMGINAGDMTGFLVYPFNKIDAKDTNDTSIVMKIRYGLNSLLLTGDIGEKIEAQLLTMSSIPESLESDVIKIAHHGSKYSSSYQFLELVSPKIAIISSGLNNPYNHPHTEVLQRLEDFGINTLRTDQMGDIKLYFDLTNIRIVK